MPGNILSANSLTGYDLVLTPNLRSARLVERTCSPAIPVNVVPWNGWTATLWQDQILAGLEDRILLNDAQTAYVWEQVLADIGPAILRPVRSIVELCIGAHRLLCDYGALPRMLTCSGEAESDTGAFAMWLQEFERRCQQERWLAAAALERAAAAALHSGRVDVYQGQRYLLYGFDPMRPAQEDLLRALETTGASIDHLPASAWSTDEEAERGERTLIGCTNAEMELRWLARSLRDHLESGVKSISVVVPNLPEVRGKLERELRTCFLPAASAGPSHQGQPQWEFSEGVPLSSVPLVRDALMALEWLQETQSPDAVSQILRSPYFQLGIELEEAGELDAHVLRNGERIRPDWSISELARSAGRRAPVLSKSLSVLQSGAPSTQSSKSCSEWIEEVRAILKTAGWPGTRERNSAEFQAVDRWDDLLDKITSLDTVAWPVRFCEFLRTLKHLCGSTLFSPQNTGAPIQIMSPSECEGTTAEILFFTSAGEKHWNSRRSPHPLLPFPLQKEFGMPGTDPVRDDAEAWLITGRITRSATQVHFSYSASENDSTARPSTLVTRLPNLQLGTNFEVPPELPAVELDKFLDDSPLPELPDASVSGGVSILQHQAACAFRAFAERRLFSSELDTTDLGMEPRARGTLLHQALQNFWKSIGTQSELLRHMREHTLDAEIERAVDSALRQYTSAERWTAVYLEIQRERLIRLVRSWLQYEAERPPFEVLHTEHEIQGVQVGPLRMTMRVDRIDKVDDAGQPATVLIDYKTGNPDVKGWLGDRPAEPQLPLYATAAGFENVQAIAFATVKPGRKHLGLKSFPAKSRLLFPGAKEKDEFAFEHQLPEWRETLEDLASDFARGKADVGPKEYPATCQWCAQRMLCRLNPELLDDLAEEEEDTEVSS